MTGNHHTGATSQRTDIMDTGNDMEGLWLAIGVVVVLLIAFASLNLYNYMWG